MAKVRNGAESPIEILDMRDILARPVAQPNHSPVFELDETEVISDANEVQFDEDIQQETERQQQQQQQVQEPEPIDTGFMPHRDMAETIVNLLDGLQSSALPFLIEKKMFTEKEREVLQTLDTTGSTIYPENSPEQKILNKFKYYEKKILKVPFDKGEAKRLVNATERYAKTVDLKLTPLQGLMAAYSEVLFTRGKLFFID